MCGKGEETGEETHPGVKCRPGSGPTHIPLEEIYLACWPYLTSRKAGRCDKDKRKNRFGWAIRVILPPNLQSQVFSLLGSSGNRLRLRFLAIKSELRRRPKIPEVPLSCILSMKKPHNFTSIWLKQWNIVILTISSRPDIVKGN